MTCHRSPIDRLVSTRRRRQWCRVVPFLCLGAALAVAQPASPSAEERGRRFHLAATDDTLWLATEQVPTTGAEPRSRIFFRSAEGAFDPGRPTSRQIADLAVLGRDLLVFFDDAGIYRYFPDPARRPTAEVVLPQGVLPLDTIGRPAGPDGRSRTFAIVPSKAAAELSEDPQGGPPTTSRAFDPPSTPLSLVAYDGLAWTAVAPLPADVRSAEEARRQPRLGLAADGLWLFAPADQPTRIRAFRLDVERKQWVGCDPLHVPDLTGFWAVTFNDRLTLVTASAAAAGGETIQAYRLLGDSTADDGTEWHRADLQFSELPPEANLVRYTDAVGFNQHLGLLALDSRDNAYLRFAFLSGPPAESTVSVTQLLVGPALLQQADGMFQVVTFALLLGVLTVLFVFRRGSMVNVVPLPPGRALALNLQRLLGWLIDFTPFSIAAASVLDIPWSEGLRSLAKWGIVPDQQGGLPERDVLLWWALSVAGHTMYMLVMELLTRRTVGKVIARVDLISESGARPGAGQILARNLTRLVEFMPQFWVFAVLVLLSRNRQRLGDIFARTVAVRRVPTPPAGSPGASKSPSGAAKGPPGEQSEDTPAAEDDERAPD